MSAIERICAIPRDFYALRDRSFYDLIEASGYREIRPTLTIEAIEATLEANPELVEPWQLWSMNKRTSGGWALGGDTERGWYVEQPFPERLPDGRPNTAVRGERRTYARLSAACADYVLSEIDSALAARDGRKSGRRP